VASPVLGLFAKRPRRVERRGHLFGVMIMDDWDLLAGEIEEETEGQQRALSTPKTLSSEEIEAKYRNVSHQSVHESAMIFEDEDAGTVECQVGVGVIGSPENPAEVLVFKKPME
jgi:hypothetical protein